MTVVLNIAAFCVIASFLRKVLDLNTNLILLGKWPRSSLAVRPALFACFSLFLFFFVQFVQVEESCSV